MSSRRKKRRNPIGSDPSLVAPDGRPVGELTASIDLKVGGRVRIGEIGIDRDYAGYLLWVVDSPVYVLLGGNPTAFFGGYRMSVGSIRMIFTPRSDWMLVHAHGTGIDIYRIGF